MGKEIFRFTGRKGDCHIIKNDENKIYWQLLYIIINNYLNIKVPLLELREKPKSQANNHLN